MDTSEEYVRMCDCPEIQGRWKSEQGDYCFFRDRFFRAMHITAINDGKGWALLPRDANYGWLPRQDQIQEMMGIDSVSTFETAVYEMFFESDNHAHYNATPEWRTLDYDSSERFATPEQLWLAFYMYEKHGKVWDGDKWE